MNKKRRLAVIIWIVILATATVIIWQMLSEHNSDGSQSVDSSAGVAEQTPATPAPIIQPSDTETTFKAQVLRYYEILHTEDPSKQMEMLPNVATSHFMESSQWRSPNGSASVSTTVDPTRSTVIFEESPTDKNVRYATAIVYVMKIDTSTNERYESLYPTDDTTWVRGTDGVWKIYATTQPNNSPA